MPLGDPCVSAAGALAPCPFWLDNFRSVRLKDRGGDALMSSLLLCAKLLVQNSETAFFLPVQSCQEG